MPRIVLNVISLHPHKNPGWGYFFIPVSRVRTARHREVKERALSLPEHVRAGVPSRQTGSRAHTCNPSEH